jgi:uncharacterized protein YdaU (DUF1376 family)
MHYYKFNIGDWHLHTSHLTLVEEAVYFRLVNHYYNTEKPFKADETQTLIRRLRLGDESDIVPAILDEFFVFDGESYVHARCEKEIKTFKKKAKVNKANGAKGGRPPAPKGLEPNPNKTQTVSENNPNITLNTNHKPLTTNQEPIKDICADKSAKKVRQVKPDSFKSFYSNYPAHRKGGTDATAWTKWKSLKITEQDALLINQWVESAINIAGWKDSDYVPGITKFLTEKRWLSPLPTSKNKVNDISSIEYAQGGF